jgi:hypothetical protein
LLVPSNDSHEAQEYCEAYGGQWNLYSNATQTASWYECDFPDGQSYDPTQDCDENPGIYSPGDVCYLPPVTDPDECAELDGTIDTDGTCIDEEGNAYYP